MSIPISDVRLLRSENGIVPPLHPVRMTGAHKAISAAQNPVDVSFIQMSIKDQPTVTVFVTVG